MLGMGNQRHLDVDKSVKNQTRRQSIGIGFDRDAGIDPLLMKFVEDVLCRRRQNIQPDPMEVGFEIGKYTRE